MCVSGFGQLSSKAHARKCGVFFVALRVAFLKLGVAFANGSCDLCSNRLSARCGATNTANNPRPRLKVPIKNRLAKISSAPTACEVASSHFGQTMLATTILKNASMPPHHDCVLPFRWFVIGQAGYTPTVFNSSELQGCSWARELVQAIVFASLFIWCADLPTNHLTNPALDVLKDITVVTAETAVLPGTEIGDDVASARHSKKTLFGSVINEAEHITLDRPLNFLPPGKNKLIRLGDSPNRYVAGVRKERAVRRNEHFSCVCV